MAEDDALAFIVVEIAIDVEGDDASRETREGWSVYW